MRIILFFLLLNSCASYNVMLAPTIISATSKNFKKGSYKEKKIVSEEFCWDGENVEQYLSYDSKTKKAYIVNEALLRAQKKHKVDGFYDVIVEYKDSHNPCIRIKGMGIKRT